ncbi:maltose ABC transporter periplasmic protein [bacterium BMS3Abin02]|nr:maltose ABC transporter periplasmic protein [bacterium BMS3Abin02]
MKRWRGALLVLVVFSMIAVACGGTTGEVTPETVTVTVQVPGETVTSIVTETKTVEVETPTITFWSTETQPARVQITQGIIDRFTAATGINVIPVYVDENALPETMVAAAASGTLPDVVFHPIDFTVGWAEQGLLDMDAAAEVVKDLGADTFAQGALNMATVNGTVAAVPSDGWGQLLIYRQDLFDANSLDRPDTYQKIELAAKTLNDPGNNFYGITASTDAGAVFTQQTFEHFALANDCQLTDDAGNVTLDTPECIEAIRFYTNLLKNYSPGGTQDVVTTRATYFAGQAAMIVWSPFIMDEMAGLRDSALPTCPECVNDPAYLAKNSGFVPAFAGPNGSPAQYGQISYLGIGTGSNTDAAKKFIEFWLGDGYLDWLSTSVEGKFPMRRGTPDDPTKFIDGWKDLKTGVDRKAPLSDFYSPEVINELIAGADNFQRWGFLQGQGQLVTAIYTSLPVPKAIRDVLDGTLTPETAAADLQAEVEQELELLK